MRIQETIKSGTKALIAVLITFALAGTTTSQVISTTIIDESTPVNMITDNPCTPVFDNTNLAGETKVKGQIMTDETGVQYFNGHIKTVLRGVDDFGVQYVINEELKVKNKFPGEGPFIETYHFNVITSGPSDNYFIKTRYQISTAGKVESFFESGCRK